MLLTQHMQNRGGSIPLQLTSCLTGSDMTKEVNILLIQHKQNLNKGDQEISCTVILSPTR